MKVAVRDLSLGVAVVLYVVVGGIVFHYLESVNHEDTQTEVQTGVAQFFRNHSCVTREDFLKIAKLIITAYQNGRINLNVTDTEDPANIWDYYNSIFFSTTVVTTIGYGNQSPATKGGQIFCIFYALLGIPLCLVYLAILGQRIHQVSCRILNCLLKMFNSKLLSRTAHVSVLFTIGICFLILIPAYMFTKFEHWDFGTAIYYCFITMSTIGFGDYVAGLESNVDTKRIGLYRLCVAAWIYISLAWFSSVIAGAQEYFATTTNKIVTSGKNNENEANGDIKSSDELDGDNTYL